MRLVPLLFALVSFALFSPRIAEGADDTNLISNGNFETVTQGQDWPEGWGRTKDQTITWQQESGNHFLRLHSEHPGQMIVAYRAVTLPAEAQALTLKWRWRVSDLKPGKQTWFDARIMLEFKDASGQKLHPGPSAPYVRKSTDGWVERTATFLVPEGARTLEFMPALFQTESGTLDLDDVELITADPEPLKQATAKAAATATAAVQAVAEAPAPSKWPQELHVAGNQVLNKDGQAVWLQGVNVVSLEFLAKGDHVLQSIRTAVDEWKANIIRLPVREDFWFGRGGGQNDGGAGYRALVDAAITMTANRGAYVLLDLHRFGAPKQEHADFWKDAAAKYKDHPAVLFDLFNEPHDTTWEVWRNGGFVPEKTKPADEDAFLSAEEKAKAAKGFQSIGMQALLEAVRSSGAHNVVIVGGLDWSYDLSGIAQGFGLTDHDGHGIIYASHIYPWKRDWPGKVLVVVDKFPIILGEVGADIHKMDFIPKEAQEDPATWVPDMLGLIQKYHLHWTGFSFHPKATPVMIEDWTYTPTPFWGAFAKRALAGERFELKRMR